MPLVSVVMPSYNHERYLCESIMSVLDQSIEDIELIVVDDFSKDGSRELIERISREDSRVKPFFNEKNMGIARTMNRAIEATSGEYIAFTASDDVWLPDKLLKQIGALAKNRNCVIWSDGEIINESGSSMGMTFVDFHNAKNRKKSGYILDDLLGGNYVFGTSRILRRANIENVRFNESLRYLDDYEFEIELAKRYDYFFIDEPLAKYRIHPGNTILSRKKDIYEEAISFRNALVRSYSHMMSRKTKARIRMSIAGYYLQLNDRRSSRSNYAKAIGYNPFDVGSYTALLRSLADPDSIVIRLMTEVKQKVIESRRG